MTPTSNAPSLARHGPSARDSQICLVFWLFGETVLTLRGWKSCHNSRLINNVLYVIILAAAVDIVPAATPKGIVLCANIAPAFLAKLLAPFFIDAVPYSARMLCLVFISIMGMAMVASMQDISGRLCGIAFASLSYGLGELSFLGLTHHYGEYALAGFASGTGAAGLIGAGLYFAATTYIGLSARRTIYASSGLPVVILLCYYAVLPSSVERDAYMPLPQSSQQSYAIRSHPRWEDEASLHPDSNVSGLECLRQHLRKTKDLICPYMLPMFIVYASEYTSIGGVAPTLLFPPENSPFSQLREFYPAYNAVYQLGVFISRSSILILQIQNLYLPSLLQLLNLALLVAQATLYITSQAWSILLFYLWTGLLGGAVYVNTFAKISNEVAEQDREFSLQVTGVADSAGILLASILSMVIEPAICSYQMRQDRYFCKQV